MTVTPDLLAAAQSVYLRGADADPAAVAAVRAYLAERYGPLAVPAAPEVGRRRGVVVWTLTPDQVAAYWILSLAGEGQR